jgi:CheY-like chemotaxis protein
MWSAALKPASTGDIVQRLSPFQKKLMTRMNVRAISILIVVDAQDMRDSMETLLRRDGYHVKLARDEAEAVEEIHGSSPDLILISAAGTTEHIVSAARRIRQQGGLTESTPVVIFSITNFPEGLEEQIGGNIFVTAPDNFDQLRALLVRILARP